MIWYYSLYVDFAVECSSAAISTTR